MPGRTLAIGDIHGCLLQLDALIDAVRLTTDDHLILLGDLIDRGPDSAGVIRRAIQLREKFRVSVIMGNHEEMMLAARAGLDRQRDWVLNGGDATLVSYAGNRATLHDVPSEHWRFLEQRLLDYVETDTHIFVHASAYADWPMDQQPGSMLRWERCDTTAPYESGKVIVCGHTHQRDNRVLNRGFMVCIDTHACGGRALTCLDATTGRVWQADKRGLVARSHLSDFEDA
jgi:serine/threonine protein phosphatase 1